MCDNQAEEDPACPPPPPGVIPSLATLASTSPFNAAVFQEHFLPILSIPSSSASSSSSSQKPFSFSLRYQVVKIGLEWALGPRVLIDREWFDTVLDLFTLDQVDYDEVEFNGDRFIQGTVQLCQDDVEEMQNAVLSKLIHRIKLAKEKCGRRRWTRNVTTMLTSGARIVEAFAEDENALDHALEELTDIVQLVMACPSLRKSLIREKSPAVCFALEYARDRDVVADTLSNIDESELPEWLVEEHTAEPPLFSLLEKVNGEQWYLTNDTKVLEACLSHDSLRQSLLTWTAAALDAEPEEDTNAAAMHKALLLVWFVTSHQRLSPFARDLLAQVEPTLRKLSSAIKRPADNYKMPRMVFVGDQLEERISSKESDSDVPPMVDIDEYSDDDDIDFGDLDAPLPAEVDEAEKPIVPVDQQNGVRRKDGSPFESDDPIYFAVVSSAASPAVLNALFPVQPSHNKKSTQNEKKTLWQTSDHEAFLEIAQREREQGAVQSDSNNEQQTMSAEAFFADDFDSFMDHHDSPNDQERNSGVDSAQHQITLRDKNGNVLQVLSTTNTDKIELAQLKVDTDVILVDSPCSTSTLTIVVGFDATLVESQALQLKLRHVLGPYSHQKLASRVLSMIGTVETELDSEFCKDHLFFSLTNAFLSASQSQNRQAGVKAWSTFCKEVFQIPAISLDMDLTSGDADDRKEHFNQAWRRLCPDTRASSFIRDTFSWSPKMKEILLSAAFACSSLFADETLRLVQEYKEKDLDMLDALLFLLVLANDRRATEQLVQEPVPFNRPGLASVLLFWLHDFHARYQALRKSGNADGCKTELEFLLKLCLHSKGAPPALRLASLGTCAHLLRRDMASISAVIGSKVSSFLKLGLCTPCLDVQIGALSIVEQLIRRSSSVRLSGNDFDNLCSPDESVCGNVSRWGLTCLSAVLMISCSKIAREDLAQRSEMLDVALTSYPWTQLCAFIEDANPSLRSRALQYFVTSCNEYEPNQFLDRLAASNLEDIHSDAFGFIAHHVFLHAKPPLARHFVMTYVLPHVHEHDSAHVSCRYFLTYFTTQVGADYDEELTEILVELLTTSQEACIVFLELFCSAFKTSLRPFAFSHFPVLLQALEKAQSTVDPSWLSTVLAQLAPFAASVHLHAVPLQGDESSSAQCLERLLELQGVKQLSKLDLSHGRISCSDVLGLSNILQRFQVTEISFANNELGDDGATTVSSWLTQDAGLQLESLCLSRNNISSQGLKSLAASLRCTESKLKSLDLSGNNLTSDGDDATGIMALAESLVWNSTLQVLDLSANHLTEECISLLLRSLRFNGSINMLHVEGISIGVDQWRAMNEKLRLNQDGLVSSPHLSRSNGKKTVSKSERTKIRETMKLLAAAGATKQQGVAPIESILLRKTNPPSGSLEDYVFAKSLKSKQQRNVESKDQQELQDVEVKDSDCDDDVADADERQSQRDESADKTKSELSKMSTLQDEISQLTDSILEIRHREKALLQKSYNIIS